MCCQGTVSFSLSLVFPSSFLGAPGDSAPPINFFFTFLFLFYLMYDCRHFVVNRMKSRKLSRKTCNESGDLHPISYFKTLFLFLSRHDLLLPSPFILVVCYAVLWKKKTIFPISRWKAKNNFFPCYKEQTNAQKKFLISMILSRLDPNCQHAGRFAADAARKTMQGFLTVLASSEL